MIIEPINFAIIGIIVKHVDLSFFFLILVVNSIEIDAGIVNLINTSNEERSWSSFHVRLKSIFLGHPWT